MTNHVHTEANEPGTQTNTIAQVRLETAMPTAEQRLTVGMVPYPGFTALDLIGPQYLFSLLPEGQ